MRGMRTLQFIFLSCLVLVIGGHAPALGADRSTGEYAVKAALVYNFARFTEWPDGTFGENQDSFNIVIFGNDNLADGFEAIVGREVAGRRIDIVHAKDPEEAAGCQLIFLAKTERERWPQIVASVADAAILTIGEMNGFLEAGGMMNLHMEDSKIRFQVNVKKAKNNKLTISSRILKLASAVVETVGEHE